MQYLTDYSMGVEKMKLSGNTELTITSDALKYAKLISSPIKNEKQRKRAFAAIVALDSLADYLLTQKITVSITKSLFKVAPVNEEFELADVYYNNWNIDVRITTDEGYISIPKSHFSYDISPDIYVGIKVSKDLSTAEFVGYVEPQDIDKNIESGEYYMVPTETMSDVKTFVDKIKKQNSSVKQEENHEIFYQHYIAYLEKELDTLSRKAFIKHLVSCPECRSNFVEFYDFESIVKNFTGKSELFEDHTLSIVSGKEAELPQYENKEEVIVFEDDEEKITDNENDILNELFAENTADEIINNDESEIDDSVSINETTHSENGSDNITPSVVSMGAIVVGAAAAGIATASTTAAIQSSTNAITAVAEASGAVAEIVSSTAEIVDALSKTPKDTDLIKVDELNPLLEEEKLHDEFAIIDEHEETLEFIEDSSLDIDSEILEINDEIASTIDNSSLDLEIAEETLVDEDHFTLSEIEPQEDFIADEESGFNLEFQDFEDSLAEQVDEMYEELDKAEEESIEFNSEAEVSDLNIETIDDEYGLLEANEEDNFEELFGEIETDSIDPEISELVKEAEAESVNNIEDDITVEDLDQIAENIDVLNDFNSTEEELYDEEISHHDDFGATEIQELELEEDSFIKPYSVMNNEQTKIEDDNDYNFVSNEIQEYDITENKEENIILSEDQNNTFITTEPFEISIQEENEEISNNEDNFASFINEGKELIQENETDNDLNQEENFISLSTQQEELSPTTSEDSNNLKLLYETNDSEEQIEDLINKSDSLSILKDKRVIIASCIVGCLILSSIFGAIAGSKKQNNNSNSSQPSSEQLQGTVPQPESTGIIDPSTMNDENMDPQNLSRTSSAYEHKDMDKVMSNVFDSNPSTVSITKISWEVPQSIAKNEAFAKYLQIAGKNLQINLKNDLINATEFTYNDNTKIALSIGDDNKIRKLEVINSSGSDQIDQIVLQSIKETLKYINVPQTTQVAPNSSNGAIKKDITGGIVYNLRLVINF